jgi:hypothetical protein
VHHLAVVGDDVDPVGDDGVAPCSTRDPVALPVLRVDRVPSAAPADVVLARAAVANVGLASP